MAEFDVLVESKVARLLGGNPPLQVDHPSLAALVEQEPFDILQPTISIKKGVLHHLGDTQNLIFDSDRYLETVVDRRIEMMGGFLCDAMGALAVYQSVANVEIAHGKEEQGSESVSLGSYRVIRTMAGDGLSLSERRAAPSCSSSRILAPTK